jgi:hypothetical protein
MQDFFRIFRKIFPGIIVTEVTAGLILPASSFRNRLRWRIRDQTVIIRGIGGTS